MKVAILTSPSQWLVPYAMELKTKIENSEVFNDHRDIDSSFDIVFILGYHKIIEKKYLDIHKHNIVLHESALPKGKGWAPMFWQILEGKNEIPFTMFEAGIGVDDGNIYMQQVLTLNGYELNRELRKKQADLTLAMCLEFINNYDKYKNATPQKGKESIYPKRTPKDSEIDITKTLEEQFNLLRTVDNEAYPAFFYKDGKKYILKIEEAKDENR